MSTCILLTSSACVSASNLPSPSLDEFEYQVAHLKVILGYQNALPADLDVGARDQLGVAYSFFGLDELAEQSFPLPDEFKQTCAPTPQNLSREHEADAISSIVDAVELSRTRVVILNEAHHRSYNRTFASQLFTKLRARGFNMLAIETADAKYLDRIDANKLTITSKFGNYSNETQFAEMLRRALSLGFKIIPYEADFTKAPKDGAWLWREKTQAENLVRNSEIVTRRDSKLIVYVGYGHASDAELPSTADRSKTFMAGWFKINTGIDPYTISQTNCFSHVPSSESDLGYRAVYTADRISPESGRGIDIKVRPGIPNYFFGRGVWRLNGGKKWIPVERLFEGVQQPFVLEARVLGEKYEVVPVDRVLVLRRNDLAQAYLALQKGRNYCLVAISAAGVVLKETCISI